MNKAIKIVMALACILLLLPASVLAETAVASFYPIYVFAMNLAEGIDGLEVRCLAAPGTGCLHDYQLQTGDMKALAQADVFLINGAGMESFLTNVVEAFPEMKVVDASEGIELMRSEDMEILLGEAETEVNAHIWLDVKNAETMVCNLCEGMASAWPQYREQLEANRDRYLVRLEQLDADLTDGLKDVPHHDIITFHEAFPYFAKAYGLNVPAVVSRDPEDSMSPAQLSRLIDKVNELGLPPLFVEPQYQDIAAQTIAAETGASIWELDPVVTGPEGEEALSAYENGMRKNLSVLQEALK